MTGRDHNKLLSIFFFVQGGLQLFGGLIAVLLYGGMGVFVMSQSRKSEEQMAGGVFLIFAVVVGVLILAFAGVTLLAGWKMLKEKQGAKTFGIIASILSLLSFPLGTALGVYGLWFLFGDAGKRFYDGGGNTTGYDAPPRPPSPNSWQ
jgi:hypothetical protein